MSSTRRLWSKQDQHEGDRLRLFSAVDSVLEVETALYPGSYVDVAPSFVFPAVTYVDTDRRADGFFADEEGVREIIAEHRECPPYPSVRFVHGDYRAPLDFERGAFDLLISLYAGFVSEYCTDYLRIGGTLLVNPSHGDVAMASIDPRYELEGVVTSRSGQYKVSSDDLDSYLLPKVPIEITRESLHDRGRGIAYTRSPFAYLFRRVG